MDLVRFDAVAGDRCHWRAWGATAGTRRLDSAFLHTLEVAVSALGETIGEPVTGILCAGAYWSPESGGGGRHATGTAFDLCGLEWGGVRRWRTLDAPQDWGVYLGIEAILRLHVPQVLDWWTPDGRHRDHWHLDDAPRLGYQRWSHSDVAYLQAVLEHIWRVSPGAIDGKIGPKTLTAAHRVTDSLQIGERLESDETWRALLAATARRGMQHPEGDAVA